MGEKIKISIRNILGQEIYNKELISADMQVREKIEMDPSLPTGIYTLQVMFAGKVKKTSIVLSR